MTNTSLQHSYPTLLYNTLLQNFTTTLLYDTSPQHFSPTLLHHNTPSPHFSTTLPHNTSLQHFSITLLHNTSLQLFTTTLLHNTPWQHFPTTLLLASAKPASFRLSRICAKIFQELGPNSCRRFTTLISTMSSLEPFQSHLCCRIGISLPSISILTMVGHVLEVMSNGACFTPYSSTWAVFFLMYQSRYTGSIAYMILPTQQKLTLLRRVGLQNTRSTAYAAS